MLIAAYSTASMMVLAFNVARADALHVLLLLVTVCVQVAHGSSFLWAKKSPHKAGRL